MGVTAVGAGAAFVSFLSVGIARQIMPLAAYMEYKLKQMKMRREREFAEALDAAVAKAVTKARAEAVAETRAEDEAQVREWNDRRLAAEARGEKFDEPPPMLE